jgi:hypothetical protein
MTVLELIKTLETHDPDAEVMLVGQVTIPPTAGDGEVLTSMDTCHAAAPNGQTVQLMGRGCGP